MSLPKQRECKGGVSGRRPFDDIACIIIREFDGPDALEVQRTGQVALKHRVGVGAVVIFQFVDYLTEVYDLLHRPTVAKPVAPVRMLRANPVSFDLPGVVIGVGCVLVFAGQKEAGKDQGENQEVFHF